MPSKKKPKQSKTTAASARATAAQLQARLEEVLRIRLDGAELWDLREYAREKEQDESSPWHRKGNAMPLSDGQLRRYLEQTDEMIAEAYCAKRKKLVREHLAKRRNLYAKALLAGDVRAALAALRDEALLLNLYPPARVKTEHSGGIKLEIAEEIIDAPAKGSAAAKANRPAPSGPI